MKCIKIFLLFVLAFMVTTSVAFAKTVHKGDTSPVPMELCEYYEDNYDSKDFETLIIDDTCYLTVLTDEEMSIPYGENEVYVISYINVTDDPPNSVTPNPIQQPKDIAQYSNKYINLKSIVYLINKGELAPKFEKEYNLKYVKAASLITESNKMLVIQFLPNTADATRTTVKFTFNREGSNEGVSISSTADATDSVKKVLSELPLWLLEAAPEYDSAKYDYFKTADIKNAVLDAFADITDYKCVKEGNSYNVSAVIPDDINSLVLAVYSDFLSENPLTAYLQSQDSAASSEGQSTSEKEDNTKTGAFANIKVIVIGFVIAFIGGYLVYRYSKIKKI